MHPSWKIENLKRRLRKVREFPVNTCPASRHAQIMGENLPTKGGYPMLQDEPEHCAQSILVTVAALYEARSKLRKLSLAVLDGSPTAHRIAKKILKDHGWADIPASNGSNNDL